MLVSQTPQDFEIPHEPGNFFALLRAPWPVLRKAREKASDEQLEKASKLTGPILEALSSKDGADNAQELMEKNQYKEVNFDTETLLEACLVGWAGEFYGHECNEENRALLDEETMVWAKQQIIDITKPPDEEEEKN